jgi:hypothetical protein
VSLVASLVLLTLAALPLSALAWNIPGHMLSAAIVYQVLRQESPQTIEKVKAVLEKHRQDGGNGCQRKIVKRTFSYAGVRMHATLAVFLSSIAFYETLLCILAAAVT